MTLRSLLTISLLTGALVAPGCGPTKAGLEARANARSRLGAYTAQFTYDQARQEYEAGQLESALREIDAAIAQVPDAASFHLLRGRILLEMHRLERAIEAFTAALENGPDLADAHYYAGVVYQRWSDDEQAFEHYRQAYELESDQLHYLLATAEALVALGELDAAEELIESKLNYFENNVAMQHLRGQIALLRGDPETATRLYAEARLLDPDNLMLLEELAWAQYDSGQFVESLETVRTLQVKLDEERSDLLHLEARCLTMLDHLTQAHGLYVRLTQQLPNEPSVWIEFGMVAWELGDVKRVAQCGARTIALAPERFEGHLLEGLHERQAGRLAEAAEAFRQAANRASDTVMPHLLLGRTLEESGQLQAALTVYAEALQADPVNAEARVLFGQLQSKMRVAVVE